MGRFTYCQTCWSLLTIDITRVDFVLCRCNAKTFSCDCASEWCCTECWRPTSYIEPGKGYCSEGRKIVSTTRLHKGALAYYQEGDAVAHFFAEDALRRAGYR